MHIKRWLGLVVFGLLFISLGIAYLFVEAYRTYAFPEFAATLTLQFLPRVLRALLFAVIGGSVVGLALIKLNMSLLSAVAPNGNGQLVDLVYSRRQRNRWSQDCRHRRRHRALDAASRAQRAHQQHHRHRHRGRRRRQLRTPAARARGTASRRLPELHRGARRVRVGDVQALPVPLQRGHRSRRHSFGNLFIVAMSNITGNFEHAIRESSRVLAVRGQILPSTLANLTLCAELENQVTVGASLPSRRAPKRSNGSTCCPSGLRRIPRRSGPS